MATAASGCPDVTGVYAWPFIEGRAQGFDERGIYARNGAAEFFGLTLPDRGEVEIRALSNRKGQGLHFIARQAEEAPQRGWAPVRRQPPTHQRFLDERIHCANGWLVVDEYPLPDVKAREQHGSTVRVGAKLAPLADGGLAIGQWLRVTDLHGSLFRWGDVSVGSVRQPDRVEWSWSRYQRSNK